MTEWRRQVDAVLRSESQSDLSDAEFEFVVRHTTCHRWAAKMVADARARGGDLVPPPRPKKV